MERFIFIIAVTIAVIFGVWHFWGAPNVHFSDDSPFGHTDAMMNVAPEHSAPQTYVASSIEIAHAAARVTITPEDRTDISLEIDNPGHAPTPSVVLEGGQLSVDGHLRGRVQDCSDDGGVRLRGYGSLTQADLPRIIVHTPRELTIRVTGGSNTEIGAAQRLNAAFSGCGDSHIADVAGPLDIDAAGSGDITTGAANGLDIDLTGAGTVTTGAIADHASLSIAGSGEVTIASLTGELKSDSAGSGSVTVQGGAITTASVEMAGSGDIDIAAPIQHLKVEILGSGDVDVTAAVGDVDAEIAGSGSAHVQSATGSVRQQVLGSGQLRVGN